MRKAPQPHPILAALAAETARQLIPVAISALARWLQRPRPTRQPATQWGSGLDGFGAALGG